VLEGGNFERLETMHVNLKSYKLAKLKSSLGFEVKAANRKLTGSFIGCLQNPEERNLET
jgi:hypothetical protein